MFAHNYEKISIRLVEWIRKKVRKAGARGGIVGLSGGIDSSVTAVLLKKAFPEQMMGLILPCYSKEKDLEDAKLLAEKYSINYKVKKLDSIFEQFLNVFANDENLAREKKMEIVNIKPRLRMTALYYYAAKKNYLVIGTDNWSELKIGYFTKFGDGGVDLAPLGRLVKTEVRELARFLNIPEHIINKTPSAGLWEGQTDEGELGFSYEVLDRYILTGEASPVVKKKVDSLAGANKHKLEPIPVPEREFLI